MTKSIQPGPSSGFLNAIAWLTASTIATFMAFHLISLSYTPDGYVPAGNDSFYHARRILDAVDDPEAFYEFDPKIHAPDGSWISWPWAYDFSMALVARIATTIDPSVNPISVLVYIPAIWSFVNVGLLMAVTAALGLGLGWRLLAGLAFGLSAVNQALHGIGMIDHHFIELTFILLAIWSSMKWCEHLSHTSYAALTGGILALAPAFHIALFILQVPVILAIFRLWIRKESPSRRAGVAFFVTLLSGTLVMLLGSKPFWNGFWEYYLFSWFHLYVAACTGLAVLVMSNWRYRRAVLFGLFIGAVAAAIPLVRHILGVSGFFGQTVPGLTRILEMQPILWFFHQDPEYWFFTYFTALVVLTPLTFVGCAFVYLLGRERKKVPFAAFGILSLPLFFLQFRFQYFGIVFLVIGPIWAAHELLQRRPEWRLAVSGIAISIYLAGFAPSFANRMDKVYSLGSDPQYRWSYPLMDELSQSCKEDPGIVLASSTEGHYVRFHSECSVITNNFLLTEKDARKYKEAAKIMQWTPEELRNRRPDIEYVLATYQRFGQPQDDNRLKLARPNMLMAANRNIPLMTKLLLSPPDEISGFEMLEQVTVRFPDGEIVPYSRLYRVQRLDEE